MFFYIFAMHKGHILQRIKQCVYVYIVICNTVQLIVGKVMLRDVIFTALCGFLAFTQIDINNFFRLAAIFAAATT